MISHDYICGSSNLQWFLLTKSEVQYGSRQVILARAVGRHRWPGQPIVRFGAIGTVPRSINSVSKTVEINRINRINRFLEVFEAY